MVLHQTNNGIYDQNKSLVTSAQPTLFTVPQLVNAEPALTTGGVRFDLFNRNSNGLEASGAVVRRGRRILLHRERYLAWLTSTDYKK